MTNIPMGLDQALIEETEACIRQIQTFQKSHRRKVHKLVQASDDGWREIHRLEDLGLTIPDDFKALYANYNGVRQPDSLMPWHADVFLDYRWPDLLSIVDVSMIARHHDMPYASEKVPFLSSESPISFDLFPTRALDGAVPLVANQGYLSRQTFIAFDSTLAMLRSVCAAQDASVIRFQTKDEETPDGGFYRKGQTRYDVKELWDAIRPHNRRADYWQALIDGPIDWKLIDLDLPDTGGVIDMPSNLPGQERIRQELEDEFEAEARAKGWADDQIRAAKEPSTE